MRLFIAIDFPPEIAKIVVHLQKTLQKQELFVGTYPNQEAAHLTLKFLGEIEDDHVPLIAKALEKITYPPLRMRLERAHIFSSDQHIRILYISVHCPELVKLVAQLDTILQPWIAPEQRPFVAHVTLARVNTVQDQQQLLQALDALEIPHSTFMVDSFFLKQSQLGTNGTQHTNIQNYMLTT